jgi:alkylation response protein AidB-like acyl-CoA dehydrogenase
MQLVLTEDQSMLARTAGSFASESGKVARLRKLRDEADPRGYTPATWAKVAELGWTAIPFSEADGGLGAGLAEMVLVTEAMGRVLAPEPLVPCVMLAGQALAQAGSAAQKAAWLAPLIAGDKMLALAWEEAGSRYDTTRVGLAAQKKGSGFVLTGEKPHVWGGHLADAYVIAARTSGKSGEREGITLFVVPTDAKGLSSTRERRVDSQNATTLKLEGVALGADAVLGSVGAGHAVLASAVERATVALCGEMLGGASEAFERTLSYLKERKQFGVPIGSFQALKHRAARVYIELELSRSAVMAAARALDEGDAEASALVSLAKARLSDAYVLSANEAVQMHGGIGMTDEHEIGFFMKRSRACELTFGDAAFHRDRYATLTGF